LCVLEIVHSCFLTSEEQDKESWRLFCVCLSMYDPVSCLTRSCDNLFRRVFCVFWRMQIVILNNTIGFRSPLLQIKEEVSPIFELQ
jgi:hypothetical protein